MVAGADSDLSVVLVAFGSFYRVIRFSAVYIFSFLKNHPKPIRAG